MRTFRVTGTRILCAAVGGALVLLAHGGVADAQSTGALPGRGALSGQANGPGFTASELDVENQKVVVLDSGGKKTAVGKLERVGAWTLMAVIEEGDERLAVFEN